MNSGRPALLMLLLLATLASGSATAQVIRENLLQKKEQEVEKKQLESEISTTKAQPQTFDVVGLKLGMKMGDAEEIIKSNMQVSRIFTLDRVPPVLPTDQIQAYVSGKVFVRNDGLEVIALINEPPAAGDTVVAITRGLAAPQGQMPPEEVLASFREKYGAETHSIRMNERGVGAYWIGKMSPQAATPTLNTCFLSNPSLNSVVYASQLPWREGNFDQPFKRDKDGTWNPNAFKGGLVFFAWPLTPNFLRDETPRAPGSQCFAGIGMEYVQINGMDQAVTFLVDHDRYHIDFITSRKMLRSGGGNAPNGRLKIKL